MATPTYQTIKVTQEAVEAFIAEAKRWDEGFTSKGPKYFVYRLPDDADEPDLISEHPDRPEMEAALNTARTKAALEAAAPFLAAPPVEGRVLAQRLKGPAIDAALRLIAGAFRRDGEQLDSGKRPHFSIPARPDDDDTFVIDSLKQAAAALSASPAPVQSEPEAWEIWRPGAGSEDSTTTLTRWKRDADAAAASGATVAPLFKRSDKNRVAELERDLAETREERDEAVNWSAIVDRHGTDGFDALAETWLAMEPIQHLHNAVASVFSKWSNDEIMDRFKQHMSNVMQMSFVEGCLVGVKAERVNSAAAEAELQRLKALPSEAVTPKVQSGAIRICPERDGPCPHGSSCPYSIDRYSCDPTGGTK